MTLTCLTRPCLVLTCRVWDLANNTCKKVLRGHLGPIWCMMYEPTLNRIASGSGGSWGGWVGWRGMGWLRVWCSEGAMGAMLGMRVRVRVWRGLE